MNQSGCIKVFIGPMFSRKCLAEGTLVTMFDGSVREVQNISEGDLVLGDDNCARSVAGLAQGDDIMYKIEYSDSTYIVNSSHILSLKFSGCNKIKTYSNFIIVNWYLNHTPIYRYFKFTDYATDEHALAAAMSYSENIEHDPEYTKPGTVIDIPLQEYLNMPKSWRSKYHGYKATIDFAETNPVIDPYLYGLLMRERPQNITISNPTTYIRNWLEGYASVNDFILDEHNNNLTILTQDITQIYTEYRNQGIPDIYKYNSKSIRMHLLAGIIDNARMCNDIYYICDYHLLHDSIKYICNSLGFACKKYDDGFKIAGAGLNQLPMLGSADTIKSSVSVSAIGIGKYYGFELDSSTNCRFALGDFTVTHNTSSMCDAVERYHLAKKLCIIIKYAKDVRYDGLSKFNGIVTHNGIEHHLVKVISTECLEDVYDELLKHSVIGIDEAQFFTDIVEVAQKLANLGKIVICAGLDTDFRGKPFGRMAELMSLAEDINKLKAVCMKCHNDASFTSRLSSETDIEIIGGADKYIAVCRNCMWSK